MAEGGQVPNCLYWLLSEEGAGKTEFEKDSATDLQIIKALIQVYIFYNYDSRVITKNVYKLWPALPKQILKEEIKLLQKTPCSVCDLIKGTRAEFHCEDRICEWRPFEKKRFASINKDNNGSKDKDEEDEKTLPLPTLLVMLIKKNCLELWHTPNEDAYITIFINSHPEHKRINSKSIRGWIAKLASDFLSQTPSQGVIASVITLLEGVAIYDGQEYNLFIRKGCLGDKIYIDIGDPSRRVIEISKNGWYITQDCPLRFYRPKSLLPMPIPELGGSWDEVRNILNLPSKESWIKYSSWLSQAFWCSGPYLHLFVRGPQGSAKSALADITKSIIDPSRSQKRHLPYNPRELMMACQNEMVPSFDNVSGFSDVIADSLCTISTGGSSAARELYTDSTEALIYAKCPVIMNGLADPSQRGDLLDRLIVLDLDAISEENRFSEKDITSKLEKIKGKVLGALLDATVTGLVNLDRFKVEKLPRMADFVVWACACSPIFNWTPDEFLDIFFEASEEAQREIADSSRLARAIKLFLRQKEEKAWGGTAAVLLDLLNNQEYIKEGREPLGWPVDATRLSTELRRLVVSADKIGLSFKFKKSNGIRRIFMKLEERQQSEITSVPGDPLASLDKNDNGGRKRDSRVSRVSLLEKNITYKKIDNIHIVYRNKAENNTYKESRPKNCDPSVPSDPDSENGVPVVGSLKGPCDPPSIEDFRDMNEEGEWEDCEYCGLPLPPSWQTDKNGWVFCPDCLKVWLKRRGELGENSDQTKKDTAPLNQDKKGKSASDQWSQCVACGIDLRGK